MELNSMWWGLFPAAIFQGKNFGKIIMRPSTPHFFSCVAAVVILLVEKCHQGFGVFKIVVGAQDLDL